MNFSKLPPYKVPRGTPSTSSAPSKYFEEDEVDEAAESSSSKCWPGYTYFVQLNWLWKVEISEYRNRTTTLIPFLQDINHFCNFIPSYFIERFAFLIDYTSYICMECHKVCTYLAYLNFNHLTNFSPHLRFDPRNKVFYPWFSFNYYVHKWPPLSFA